MQQIGKYTVENFGDAFRITCNKIEIIISNLSSRENLILSGKVNCSEKAQEKEITHILKMRRNRLKRELLELNYIIE